MAKDKKHHYVPVCYLKHFAEDGQIYYYSKKRRQHNRCAIENICESNYFYLIQEKSWWKMLEIEKDFLSFNVEANLGKVINAIEEAVRNSLRDTLSCVRIIIGEETRRAIASMIFIQFYRTPRFRSFYSDKILTRKGISSITHQYTEERVTDKVLVHALATYLNKDLFRKTVDYLTTNQWIIRYSEDDVFLSSDNPVVWMPLKEKDSDVFTIENIGESRCFLYYPITPHIVLEIYDKNMGSISPDFDNLIIRSDPEHEFFLNTYTIINADDIVILRNKKIDCYSVAFKLEIM
jgi:hypothetical protein